jgi:hypothetical protein
VALPSPTTAILFDQLFTGKIRLRLLSRLLLNPGSQVYLRQLQKDLNVSSNTVRLELNKLLEMKLITVVEGEEGKIKKYIANSFHPLYDNLRSIIFKFIGVDQLLEEVFYKLGDVVEVYLTGDIAEGKESPFIDLVVVGDIDRSYFDTLCAKAEKLLNKKIRTAVYTLVEFDLALIHEVPHVCVYNSEWGGVKAD